MSSSSSRSSRISKAWKKESEKLTTRVETARDKMKELGEELNHRNMSSAEYWERAMDYAVLGRWLSLCQLERAEYDFRTFYIDDHGPEVKFMRMDKARLFRESMMAWDLKGKIYERRAAGAEGAETEESTRLKSLIPVSPIPPSRFNVEATFAPHGFRNSIIADQGMVDPREKHNRRYWSYLWNIFSGTYEYGGYRRFEALPVFASQSNPDLATALFGSSNIDSSSSLFSSFNGLLLPDYMGARFDSGIMAIVPDISSPTYPSEIALWKDTTPREYKLKIFAQNRETEQTGGLMQDINSFTNARRPVPLRDIDGSKVGFPASGQEGRPKECYLFFHYCVQILRQAWKGIPVVDGEKPGSDWGAVGKYVDREQMRAVIDELGGEYEGLMECAGDGVGDGGGDRYTLLEALAEQVIVSNQMNGRRDELYGDEEDEDSDEHDCDDDWCPMKTPYYNPTDIANTSYRLDE
ncbi:uncharacterized protein J4E92_007005 [Alternaria infectoria]|uniref:uncharacterized protein n=1 Tax=Alternaria infectoria TaxID=45303 RepID=UPI00221EF8C1|nr:uncharacterized protein J4E92_007005 [Alternaria infectoria]KAI4924968.1 hypothetical protein J4E92_007005 [Alternaria infectoria]